MENELLQIIPWRTRVAVRILLMVAEVVCGDEKLQAEIRKLSTHIEYGRRD